MQNKIFGSQALESALSLEASAFQQSEFSELGSIRLLALAFAFKKIGSEQRAEDLPSNSLREFLSNNNACFREVELPRELTKKRSQTLIVESLHDDGIYVVFRRGVSSYFYSTSTRSITRINRNSNFLSECKPYCYELYAHLPYQVNGVLDILKFTFSSNADTFLLFLGASIIVTLFALVVPMVVNYLVGTVLPQASSRLLTDTTILIFLILVASVIANSYARLAQLKVESLIDLRLQTATWARVMKLPIPFFYKYSISDVASRVTAITQARKVLSAGFMSSLISILFSFSFFFLMFSYDWRLGSIALAVAFLSVYLIFNFSNQQGNLLVPLYDQFAEITNFSLQSVIGLPQIRSTGSEPFVFYRWMQSLVRLTSTNQKMSYYTGLLTTLSQTIIPIGNLVVITSVILLIPSDLLVENNILVASIVGFLVAYSGFNTLLARSALQLSSTLSVVKSLWARAEVVLYSSPEPGYNPDSIRKDLQGDYKGTGLYFQYPGMQSPVLKGLSFEIKKNNYTAITGYSGCGKSTLLRLLLGFDTPQSGQILVDNLDLNQWSIRAYRQQLGVVMQNTPLPSGTVLDIIRAGRDIDLEQIMNACELASIADGIKNLDDGINTMITANSTNISGGQRQRIALARALVGNPSVLILDEATSALDAPTQAVVTATLNNLPITRIAVAHRLSTIESADDILIMKDGLIVESGSFQDLIQAEGGYLSRHK
jgi:ATP-binding cassette subfamily B protein